VDVYTRHFGCPVRFGREHNEVRLPASVLELPSAGADHNLARVLEDHARHLLAQLPDEDPFLQAARRELLEQIDTGAPSAVTLAHALRLSERTLRRRLDAEGTSYNALLDELRHDLARKYVTQTREGFEAVAERLAFADASTFFRAFKRWTGMTPAQFRERAKLARA
jgi:AraC-like DNA-binding protein